MSDELGEYCVFCGGELYPIEKMKRGVFKTVGYSCAVCGLRYERKPNIDLLRRHIGSGAADDIARGKGR